MLAFPLAIFPPRDVRRLKGKSFSHGPWNKQVFNRRPRKKPVAGASWRDPSISCNRNHTIATGWLLLSTDLVHAITGQKPPSARRHQQFNQDRHRFCKNMREINHNETATNSGQVPQGTSIVRYQFRPFTFIAYARNTRNKCPINGGLTHLRRRQDKTDSFD